MITSAMTKSDRMLLLLAGLVMGMVVFLVPAVYFTVSYRYQVGRLDSEIRINARLISQIIGANPGMWQFETVRVEEHLSRILRNEEQVLRRIRSLNGEPIATLGVPPSPPVMNRSAPLYDAGQTVGSIEVSASLFPTLVSAGLLALALMPLGGAVLLVLGLMPARAIRREVAAALQKERDTGQRYLDVAGVMLVALDPHGRVTLMNRRACKVLGYGEEEVQHRDWFEFIPGKHRAQARTALFRAEAGAPVQGETPLITRDGRERVVAWNHYALTDDRGRRIGTLSSGEDMTEKKELEAQLRHAQKMDALGQLASGVAHDFNNVLTVIVGYSSLLNTRLQHDEELISFVDQVTASAHRASQLTRSLLAFSRKQPSIQQPCDLNGILRNLQKFLGRVIGEDIQMKLVFAPAPLVIQADSGQIEQVLINLVTNARDAMPTGGVVTVEASSSKAAAGDMAVITVSDTGCGMDEETRQRIFEPFFTTKEADKGTGLGLAIVYGIVSQHGGSIEALSEKGKGTSFRISIPCLQGDFLPPGHAPQRPPARGSETVLLAEDDPDVRRMAETVLTELGYRVVPAADGEQAVRLFSLNIDCIDLCILDVVMSRKSGKEASQEILRLKPDAKVLFTSGYPADTLFSRWQMVEEENLIRKPLLPWDLAVKVRELLDGPATQ